jgi:hypothetical protein
VNYLLCANLELNSLLKKSLRTKLENIVSAQYTCFTPGFVMFSFVYIKENGATALVLLRHAYIFLLHHFLFVHSFIHQWLYSPLLGAGRYYSFVIICRGGRTPWTEDLSVSMLLPTQMTAQTQNKRTQTSMPQVGFEPSGRKQFMP